MKDVFASEKRQSLAPKSRSWDEQHSGAITLLCRVVAVGIFLAFWLKLDAIGEAFLRHAKSPVNWTETSAWFMNLLVSVVSS
jgi:hypothetical protein